MKKAILSTIAALTLAGGLAVPAFAFADGSVHFTHALNPQPLPPGIRQSAHTCAVRLTEPPDPCLQ